MKKLILVATAVVGAAAAAYSQGTVLFNDEATAGYVVTDVNGPTSSSTASYTPTANFTAALYAMPGNATLASLVDAPNADGYLSYSQFEADSGTGGFALVTTTEGGSANGVTFGGGDGYFSGGTATLPATAGGYSGGVYTADDVLAVVAWTGTAATLSAAVLAGDDIGIFAFVNNIGPGGTNPEVPQLNGWPTTLSPANSANDGYPDLLLSPVPEPTTLALAGLGGLSLMLIRRRK